MKLVMALIKPHKLNPVHKALVGIDVTCHAASEVKGFDREMDHAEVHRGTEYHISFMPMVKIEAVVPDVMVERVVGTIRQAGGTGHPDGGNIVFCEALSVVSIHTGDPDDAAP